MAASNSYSLKSVAPSSSIDTCPVKALLKYLEKVHGTVSDYLLDDRGYPKCMYLQDSFMKDLFNFYPDRICIDCTFKKFEIDLYMLLFICEDPNGINYIVAVGFLQYNDGDSLSWLFSSFKKHNPNWRKILSVAVDPAIENWELINDIFSFAWIIICSYHAMKAFKSYLSDTHVSKMVCEDEKNHAVDLFKSLLYAMTNAEFEELLQKCDTLSEILVKHLLEFWMPLQSNWRMPLDFAYEDVFKNRNKHLDELNNSIQMIFQSEKNYAEFIKKVFLMILFKKGEKPDENFPVPILYSRFSPEYLLCTSLTPYAAEFAIKQLDLSQEMTVGVCPPSEYYVFNYLDWQVQACATTCECNFYLYTLLPCRHIFWARKRNNLCQYDGSNIHYIWSKQYYEHASTCMEDYFTNSIDNRIPQDLASRTTLASHLLEITTPSLLDLPRPVYESRMNLLKNLIQAWKVDDDVSVKFIGIEKSLKKDKTISIPASKKVCISSEMIFSPSDFLNLTGDKLSISQEANCSQQNQCSEMDVNSSNSQSLESVYSTLYART